MKMNKAILLAVSSVAGLVFAGSASASITYSYVPNQATYTNVQPGASITVNIYLNEAVTSPSTSLLQASNEDGLFGAGFKLTEVSNALASPTIISAGAANSVQFDAGSGFDITTITPTVGKVSEAVNPVDNDGVQLGNTPALAGGITTPGNQVFLGTVTLIAGTTPGTTTFNLGSYGQAGSTVTFNNTKDLDKTGASGYTGVGSLVTPINVTVVGSTPEPASIGLVGLVSTLGLLARRKRNAL